MHGIVNDLHWQSDWNGDEVGYDDINVVGLYTSETLGCSFYINTESNVILEVLNDCEDDC